jgi:acyl-coenzyme A synthetase/AMP-(fatty) acid ligase
MLSLVDQDPWPPCPAPFNLAAHALAAGMANPDRIALVILHPGGVESWSFGRLVAAVRGCGTGLLALGLVPGDRVLMRLGNSVAFPILYLGALAAGLVPVPTSAALTPHEITGLAARARPALIVADAGVALPDPLPERGQSARPTPCPVLPAEALHAMSQLPPCDWNLGDPERPGYVVFTSGTSGRPQAVVHAHRALWARGMMRAGWDGFGSDDRVVHAGALNWTYTLGTGLLDPWSVGATALVAGDGLGVDRLPELLQRHDASVFAAVPGVYRQILRAGVPALPRLRRALCAGEKLPEPVRAAWTAATGTPLHEALGMSECSTYLSGCDARPAPAGATGFAQPGRRIAVLGPDGQPVPRGVAGVLAVARTDPGLMLGYLDDPDATAARCAGAWFVTGDRAVMAADGAVTALGRDDDLMNAGGYRVSPLEVEEALADLPGVADVGVRELSVGPGKTVIACFFAGPADQATLRARAETRLARYKQPRLYIRLDHLPRSANGKLNRKALVAPQEPA